MTNWIDELYSIGGTAKYSQEKEEIYIEHILKSINSNYKFLVDIGAGDGVHISNSRLFVEKGFGHILIDSEDLGNSDVHQHCITKENIVSILQSYSCPNKFDFLTIDTDGNDYWLIDEVLQHFSPNLIVAEFNGFLPVDKSVTIKYDSQHRWSGDTYFSFTLEAGKKLAKKHGYKLIFQNNNMNCYMVRDEFVCEYKEVTYTQQVFFPITERTDWIEI